MKCKKILSSVLALCIILSIGLIPTVLNASAETKKSEKVISAAIKFTNGESGVEKSSQTALYSLQFVYAPERFKLYSGDKNITSIEGNDWKLEYEYALSDALIGIGNIQVQGAANWNVAGDPAADRTDGTGKWKKAQISLEPLGCGGGWTQPLYCLALSTNTTAAVDTSKTYYAYYKNIKITDGSGKTVYSFTDDELTDGELNPQIWGSEKNANTALSVVDNPYTETPSPDPTPTPTPTPDPTPKPAPVKKDQVIKAEVKFTNGENGIEKISQVGLYTLNMGMTPARLNLGTGADACVIKGKDWTLQYEFALADAVKGFGNIVVQGNKNWATAGDAALDHTALTGVWRKETVQLSGIYSEDGVQGLHTVALCFNTTQAVDVSKTYVYYIKNIKIVDGKGNVQYNVTDKDITTEELNPQVWGSEKNAKTTLTAVDDPYPSNGEEPEIKLEKVIKLSVKYTYTKAMQGKTANISFFGYFGDGIALNEGDKLSYKVMLDSPMAGLGGFSYQENDKKDGFWGMFHTFAVEKNIVDSKGLSMLPDTDLSGVALNKWYTRTFEPANVPREACHWITPINSTKAAADPNKTYNVYFKDMKIIHADGSETVIWDGSSSYTKGEALETAKGLEYEMGVVEIPTTGTGGSGSPQTGDVNRNTAVIAAFAMVLSLAVLTGAIAQKGKNR